jgi:hypothetical protein
MNEALYGRKYRTPMCWTEICQKHLGSLEVVREMSKKLDMIKEQMKTAQNGQKSNADKPRRPIEFYIDDRVMIKASP